MRVHNEYEFIKKRSLVQYMTTQKLDLEKHFHDRASNMLTNIERYETSNLQNKLKSVTSEAMTATLAKVNGSEKESITRDSFVAALDGITKGYMDYAEDPILPILKEEISSRSASLKGLSPT